MGMLHFGDNLTVLRENVANESVDLVYLDPPFKSDRNYNLLFNTPEGQPSDAQIVAFEDTWHWGEQAEREYAEILRQPNTTLTETVQSFRRFLGENDVMAYLVMMSNRLVELHRVLKPTGSLYLHCDPTASHYLKIILDGVFNAPNFRREIIWRSGWVSGFKTRANNWVRNHDVLLYYVKDVREAFTFNKNLAYKPHKEGYARRGGGENEKGVAIDDVWDEVELYSPWIKSFSTEKLGYATQKPLALLERIVAVSSNRGDTVLDPFCGCGTAVHAAQKLGRDWIGIDITHLAICLIEKRLKDAFPNIEFDVRGIPTSLAGAHDLASRDKYQFQWWACALVKAQPYQGKKKGADSGIDGIVYFKDDKGPAKKIIVSVKGGEHVTRSMVADLKNTVEREKAQIGLFVTLAAPTKPMITEATSAGFYESPAHGAFPKIQILTIENLLSGHDEPRYPDLSRGSLTFKKAKIEDASVEQGNLF